MSDTVERLRRCELEGVAGTSGERALVVNEAFEEIEDDGVWVLWKGGGGVENESGPRSGSNGELDGEGEGEWTFMGNVKARGVGEMTFSMGALGTGSATATSRAGGGKAKRLDDEEARRTMEDSRCTRLSRVRMAGMMVIIGTREGRGDNCRWEKN
jgi:hypothetical protein